MEIKDIKAVYFVGAGGIGMSAIARYFLKKGLTVAGYDKTPSELTHELEKEGMLIHYEENVELIPSACKDAKNTLVIYTPAIPATHQELVYFQQNGFTIEKRAQVLGTLTRCSRHTRQDIDLYNVRTHHARESYRLQRIPRRHFKELWNQLHPVRQERLCSH